MLCRVAYGRHDSRRRRQNEGAGAEHDENCHRADYLARHGPGAGGGDQRGHDYPRRPAVGEADDLGLARVGGLHEADHALDGAVLADLGRPHVEGAELVHRSAGDLVARALVHGQALAGHDGLIYRGHAREYDAVDRYRLPGQDAQNIPDADVFGGDDLLRAAGDEPRGLGRELHELFDARAGFGDGQVLEQGAELHDEGHLARGEVLADDDRGDERHGDEHVGLDVKGGDEPDDGLEDYRHATEDYGHPGRVKGQAGSQPEDADKQGNAAQNQANDVLFDSAPLQQGLQLLHTHPPFIYLWGYRYNIDRHAPDVKGGGGDQPIFEKRSTAFVKLSMVFSASPCSMPSRTQCLM